MVLSVIPLHSERMFENFDIFEELLKALEKNEEKLEEGDILVISTKYISNSQGRVLDLKNIKISPQGQEISEKYNLRKEVAEIVNRESDMIFGGIAAASSIAGGTAGIVKAANVKNLVRASRANISGNAHDN